MVQIGVAVLNQMAKMAPLKLTDLDYEVSVPSGVGSMISKET